MPVAADMHVMVVDDQKAMRNLVRTALNELGCREIVECADGREAFDSLKANPVHLVVSDLNMPVMDGFQFIEQVRARPGFDGVPIIVLTTQGALEDQERARALGVTTYVTKPIRPNEVVDAVNSVVGQK